MLNLKEVIAHARRPYMSGIDRSADRVNASHEFFTPTDMLIKINDWLDSYDESLFTVSTKKFLDHSCGDGQILTEVLIRKLKSLNKEEITDIEFEQALSTIYGVDLMIDNVDICRERLLCGQEHLRPIVEKNIQCRDALKFGYNFEPMGKFRRNTEEKARVRQQKLKAKQEKLAKQEETRKKKEAQQKKLFGVVLLETA
jgi:hypothetical protein